MQSGFTKASASSIVVTVVVSAIVGVAVCCVVTAIGISAAAYAACKTCHAHDYSKKQTNDLVFHISPFLICRVVIYRSLTALGERFGSFVSPASFPLT